MAANVVVQEMNGAGPSYTTRGTAAGSTARYCTDDNAAPGLNNPIPIPDAGFNYSYWKSHTLEVSGTAFTQVSNVQWYSEGTPTWTFGTGGEVRVGIRDAGDNGCPNGSYDQASGTVGASGTPLEQGDGHTYYLGQGTPSADIGDYPTGSKLLVDSGSYTPNGTSYPNHVVTQVKVDTAGNGAQQGEQADITLTFQWDEI